MGSRRLSGNLAVALLSFLFCLGALELALRLTAASRQVYPGILFHTDEANIKLWCYDEHFIGVADYDLRAEHPFTRLSYLGNVDNDPAYTDVESIQVPKAVEVALNGEGFRERAFDQLEKRVAATAVTLVIGDSFGFGQGVRLEDRFTEILQRRLNGTDTGRQAREAREHTLINVCVPGNNVERISKGLARFLPRFSPERVIYAYTLNDPKRSIRVHEMEQSIYDFMHLRENQLNEILPFGATSVDSRLLRWVATRVARQRLAEATVDWYHQLYAPNAGWRMTQKKLREMHEVCRDAGAPMTLVVFPLFHGLADYPFAAIHEEIASFARDSGISHVDLLPAFAGGDERTYWVHPKDFHPNHLGHRVAAERLLTAIDWD